MAYPAPARRPYPSPAQPTGPVRPLPSYLPLSDLHLERIAELEALVGCRYQGWAVNVSGRFAVDLLETDGEHFERFTGDTLHQALGAAIRAQTGER